MVCVSAPNEPMIIDRPAMIATISCHWSITSPKAVNITFANTTMDAIFGADAKKAPTGVGAPS